MLDGEQVIDSTVEIAELILSIGFPEDEEGVSITFEFGLGEVFEEVPMLLLDVGVDHAFADFGFLLSSFRHLNLNKIEIHKILWNTNVSIYYTHLFIPFYMKIIFSSTQYFGGSLSPTTNYPKLKVSYHIFVFYSTFKFEP